MKNSNKRPSRVKNSYIKVAWDFEKVKEHYNNKLHDMNEKHWNQKMWNDDDWTAFNELSPPQQKLALKMMRVLKKWNLRHKSWERDQLPEKERLASMNKYCGHCGMVKKADNNFNISKIDALKFYGRAREMYKNLSKYSRSYIPIKKAREGLLFLIYALDIAHPELGIRKQSLDLEGAEHMFKQKSVA
jgi:hypothetical protein